MIRLPAAGESFGRYRLERTLGQGGMGVVYAAHDTTLGRDVAVKLVVPQYAADRGFRARFQQEAATLAKLDSAHVVSIYDHGEQDGVLFLVTQLIAGGDLLQLIHREGAMPPALAVDVLSQVALGLCDAHAVGVVHRDIKPANVLLRGRGRDLEAFLCDFGIATTPGADLSRTGTVAGSLPYMAPERHRGENAGVAGDVYAAGCLLWHVLTGSAPYSGTDVEVALGHIQGPLPQLPGKDDFSTTVNAFLRRSMAKHPGKRHPSARALHAELAQLAQLAPDSVLLPGATAFRQPIVLEKARRRWVPGAVAAVATGGVLLGTLFAAGVLSGDDRERTGAAILGDSGSVSNDAKVVNEPPVLVPDTSTRKADSWEPGRKAKAKDVPPGEESTRADPRGQDLPRSQKKNRVRKSDDPGPTKAPPPPDPWRCWNGTTSATYDGCGLPTGWTGATWLFGGLDSHAAVRNCRPTTIPWTNREVEAWRCDYGRNNFINVTRWGSSSVAVSELQHQWQRRAAAWRPTGGASWGYQIFRITKNRSIGVRIYQDVPFSIQFKADRSKGRHTGTQLSKPWRPPSNIKGVRR